MDRTEFKDLEKQWYSKLRQEGFEDIEDVSKEDRLLKSWHSFKYQGLDSITVEAIRDYYDGALRLLYTFKFESPVHKRIWELHANGMTVRDIEQQLRKYKRSMIHHIIQKISKAIR